MASKTRSEKQESQKAGDRFAYIVKMARGNLTQKEFSARLNVSQPTIVCWERGRLPSLEHLLKLAKFLDEPPETLLAVIFGRHWDPYDVNTVFFDDFINRLLPEEQLHILKPWLLNGIPRGEGGIDLELLSSALQHLNPSEKLNLAMHLLASIAPALSQEPDQGNQMIRSFLAAIDKD